MGGSSLRSPDVSAETFSRKRCRGQANEWGQPTALHLDAGCINPSRMTMDGFEIPRLISAVTQPGFSHGPACLAP